MVETEILEKIRSKLIDEYNRSIDNYDDLSGEELLEKLRKTKSFGNYDSFIKNGYLYNEIRYDQLSVTRVLGYMFYAFNGIVYIPKRKKFYEKIYPQGAKRLLVGSDVHDAVEKYALTLAPFSVEEKMTYEIDRDVITGKLDLAIKDKDGKYTIIDLKTGKHLDKDYAMHQLSIYAYIYKNKHDIDGNLDATIISPDGIFSKTLSESKMQVYLNNFIKAKNELKSFLASKKLYEFAINKN